MCSMYIISGLLHRKSDGITSLSISALIVLTRNPYAIINITFLFSFLACFGIIVIKPRLDEQFKNVLCKNVVQKYLKNSIILGLSANILLIPITIIYFNKVSFVFIISNIFASLFLSLIIPILIIFLIFSFCIPCVSKLNASILNVVVTIFIKTTSMASKIKILDINWLDLNVFQCVLYYAVVICGYFFKEHKNKIKKIFCTFISLLLILTIVSKIVLLCRNQLSIYFVDVGQGDCTYIVTQKNKKILIDGGGSEQGDYIEKNVLLPYLASRNARKLDYVIISHFDEDHVGGVLEVMRELKVKTAIIGKQFVDSENYIEFLNIVKKKNTKVIVVESGNSIKLEQDLYLDVLWPNSSNIVKENAINNNSLVFNMHYQSFSMLFTGDIEELAEDEITKMYTNNPQILKADVLKVAHHGSKTSSTTKFINCVKPLVCFIGVGKDNMFGHPNAQVISGFQEMNSRIYRTDTMGEINLFVSKRGIISIKKQIE